MSTCEKCGNQIKENNKFCEKCGAPVTDNTKSINAQEKTLSTDEVQIKPKKVVDEKKRKKRNIILVLVLILCVVGFSAYKIGESLTSKNKVVERFVAALSERNISELTKLVESSDPRLKIDEETIQPFIKYIDENPSYFDKLVTSMLEQSDNEEQNTKSNKRGIPTISRNTDSNYIALKKKGKVYFLYDRYVIELQPFFVRVSTNYKDAHIFINDKEVDISGSENYSKEFGPFVPGKYTFKSVYNGEYAVLENQVDSYLVTEQYNSDTKVRNLDLNLYGRYIYIDTNYYDSNVLVNGNNTGLTVYDISNNGFGPLDDTTKVQITREFPWGSFTSEEMTVGEVDTDFLSLYINPSNSVVKEQIMEAVNTFLVDDMQAFISRDPSKYSNLADPELNSRTDIINNMIMWEEFYDGRLNNSIYDLDSVNIYFNDNMYYAQITGLYNYDRVYYYEGYEKPDMTEQSTCYKYYLKYDEHNKKWLIYDLDYQYYFNDYNVKEYSFEDTGH